MANIKINEIKNTVTDEIIEFRTDAANDSPESITAFKTLRQVAGGCCRWAERGTRRLKSIYHKLFMVLALKSSPHHLSLINNNS